MNWLLIVLFKGNIMTRFFLTTILAYFLASTVFSATVVLTLSGRVSLVDSAGTSDAPAIGTSWRVEMRYPQDTPLSESEIEIIENPIFRIPLVTSRLTLGDQVWGLADMNFKYDRFHYVSFWDHVLPAVGGGVVPSFEFVFQSYLAPTNMIHRPYYLPSSISDWDLLGTSYFRFYLVQFDHFTGQSGWSLIGDSLDSVTFAIVPEPVSLMGFAVGFAVLSGRRRRSAAPTLEA
jgi:hypothetical protein